MVAGVLARILGRRPTLTPAEAKAMVLDSATLVTIGDNQGSAPRVLYSGINVASAGTAPSYSPPTDISVSIDGYDAVRPGDGCYFFAIANGGNYWDFTYSWRVGETETDEDSDGLFHQNLLSSGGSFTVPVDVTDGVSGGSASFEVNVSSAAGECYVYHH